MEPATAPAEDITPRAEKGEAQEVSVSPELGYIRMLKRNGVLGRKEKGDDDKEMDSSNSSSLEDDYELKKVISNANKVII